MVIDGHSIDSRIRIWARNWYFGISQDENGELKSTRQIRVDGISGSPWNHAKLQLLGPRWGVLLPLGGLKKLLWQGRALRADLEETAIPEMCVGGSSTQTQLFGGLFFRVGSYFCLGRTEKLSCSKHAEWNLPNSVRKCTIHVADVTIPFRFFELEDVDRAFGS